MAARKIRATLLVALPLALLPAAPALAGHSGTRASRRCPRCSRRGRCRSGCAGRARRRAPAPRARPTTGAGAPSSESPRASTAARSPRRSGSARSSGCPACASSRWPGRRRRWRRSPGAPIHAIRYVEPLAAAHAAHIRNDPLTYEIDPATGAPYEWQFDAVGADQALNLAKGDPSILVGVVDSGISAVPDLAGKVAETFWDSSVTKSGIDALGHGTFVASIIAARNDDGFGLAGFCGACRLAIYKASPLTDVQVAEGIRTLTDAHVRVINLSIVLDSSSQAVIDAIDYATAAGVLVVAASGNEGTDTIDFPASYVQPPDGTAASGIAVGASDRAGRRASFSNAAPGSRWSPRGPSTRTAGRASSARSRPRRRTSAAAARARSSSRTSRAGRATPMRAGRASRRRRWRGRRPSSGRSSRR